MAAVDELGQDHVWTELIRVAVWQLFNLTKDRSYKFRIYGVIPVSISVAKLRPLVEQWVGAEPATQ
jgi:hypothetical protein